MQLTKVRPFLKWAGNKYRCLDLILQSFPKANRLIEPFAGSGAVFINTNYPSYLLAEQNADLTYLFKSLQQEGEVFIDYCAQYFTSRYNDSLQYYQFRTQFNQSRNPRQRAALFLYLNRHGYNGLCRYNQQGLYNVPFGRHNKPYFPRREMLYFHEKSQQADFVQADFRATFEQAQTGDVIYCDPPYAPRTQQTNFTSYTEKKFGAQEQIILAQLAIDCANKGITVLISNHDTEFTRHHYQAGDIRSFPVKRSISRNVGDRMSVKELLVTFRGE